MRSIGVKRWGRQVDAPEAAARWETHAAGVGDRRKRGRDPADAAGDFLIFTVMAIDYGDSAAPPVRKRMGVYALMLP